MSQSSSTDERLVSFLDRMRSGQRTRIVAFGSSNTEARNRCRFNWVDWFDTGLKATFGRVHHTINAGISGDTSVGLLSRFETDVALYQPHLVIVTIGGNDALPDRNIGPDVFHQNLSEIGHRVRALEATLVYQTYYGCDLEKLDPPYAEALVQYMDIIRDVAADVDAVLVDHYARWERLRKADVERFRDLMNDPLHVKPAGNTALAMDLLRVFGASVGEDYRTVAKEGLEVQRRMDELERLGIAD